MNRRKAQCNRGRPPVSQPRSKTRGRPQSYFGTASSIAAILLVRTIYPGYCTKAVTSKVATWNGPVPF
jgi:hypothetical protein